MGELPAGTVAGYQSVGKNNDALTSALNSAPISVTVDADNSWQSYRSGVLNKNCGLFGQIDHAVIAVGYNTADNTFKIRNSWGASWGEAGYVRVSNAVTDPYFLYKTAPFHLADLCGRHCLSNQTHRGFFLLTAGSQRAFFCSHTT